MKKILPKLTEGILAMLLCVVAFTACSTPDIPKLLEQGKTAFYKANYSEAKNAFKECADAGDSQGQYWLAVTTFKSDGHYSETDTLAMSKEETYKYCYDLFKKSADQNDGDGYYGLALCFANGYGVAQDKNKYTEYLDKSVELNSSFGKAWKGHYLVQKGGKENVQKGIALIKESADAGNYDGKCLLGAYYMDGVGVEKNINKGLKLLQESASHYDRRANSILARLYFFGTESIKANHAKAFKYAKKGGNDGTTTFILSMCYWTGKGTEKNEKLSAAYAWASANHGFAPGQRWWAAFCEDDGTEEEAFGWYKKAADQGDMIGMEGVGRLLLTGKAGKTDYATAKRYLKKAASMGSQRAQQLLSTYQWELSQY